jgi:CcmD family protein
MTRVIVAAGLAAWLAGVAPGLMAQSPVRAPAPAAAAGAAQNPQDQFVPVKDLPHAEQLPAARLVMLAYAFVWAVLLLYVWTVWRRLLKVEREIKTLAARLSERGGQA